MNHRWIRKNQKNQNKPNIPLSYDLNFIEYLLDAVVITTAMWIVYSIIFMLLTYAAILTDLRKGSVWLKNVLPIEYVGYAVCRMVGVLFRQLSQCFGQFHSGGDTIVSSI